MMKRLVFFFALLFSFIFVPLAHADEGWIIDNFQADIAVQESGEVRVVETLDVDFKDLDKHGIYRDIPFEYESNGELTYTNIDIASVLQDDKKAKYDTSVTDGYIRVKIGDPDETISGRHIYVITYTARGVLRGFQDHDELYWNITGNQWGVPISHVEAVVTLPKEEITRITCFEGFAGSTAICDAKRESSQLARFTTFGELGAGQGLTVVVGYTRGIVPILTVERPKTFFEKLIEWPSLATIAIILFAGIVTVLYRWFRHGRDYWFAQNIFGKKGEQGNLKPIGAHETLTVEFTPPEKLRPAEMGVLMDERADTNDVVATIIDLATRGYLTITEIPKKWVFGKVDYTLAKKVKDDKDLLNYEKKLLHNLFKTGNEVKMSDLKTTFYDELQEVKKELYKDVVEKGLFPTDPEKVRGNYLGIGIVLTIACFFGIFISIGADLVFGADIALGGVVVGLLLMFMSTHMPRRTAYGRELYRRVRGYQLFINTAEKHRQVFFEKRNMFNEVLPYAIAFSLTEKFAKQMKNIGIEPKTTGWYSGVHPIHAGTFGASMNSFSNSMSSAIASTPSSSGGFSGGSSGGGFGGGGGGSW